jgi:predicted nucleic acid-binding protein
VSRKLLLDLNVILDVLLDRKPHVTIAAALWSQVELGNVKGYVAAHGITTIHYLAERARGKRFARQTVGDLLSVFQVVAVDEKIIRQALSLTSSDFEDAVCAACAATANCEAIVTRDPAGSRGSPVSSIDPATALAWLNGSLSS